MVELSKYPRDGLSPSSRADGDIIEIIRDGCPTVRSLEELVLTINQYLENPQKDSDIRKRLLDFWDYRNPRYVEMFLSLVDGSYKPSDMSESI